MPAQRNMPFASKYTAGFRGSCIESELMTQVPSNGLCAHNALGIKSIAIRSLFIFDSD